MLAFFRRHRWFFNWFLVAVVFAFVWFYVPSLVGKDSGTPGETVARVGGTTISVAEFQRAYFQQRQRLEQLYQKLDPAMLRRLGLEDQVLDALVNEKLVLLEARRLGLSVEDETLAREISKIPGLQENGRFVGGAEYRRRLEGQGRSVEEFEEAVRAQLLRQKLEALVTDGVTVSPTEAEQEYRRRNEQIKAEYVLVDSVRYRPETTASDDEVKARFDAKKEAYRVAEKRVVSYLLFDTEALQSRVTITDRDVEAYYQEHRDEFKEEEQACASHILVKVKEGPDAKEGHADAEAKTIADGLLAQVKGGADFVALAKKASEDKGSASNGGDLGCFPRGQMVPEFENAAFSMKPGTDSELVKSSFGYHIIHLVSHRDEATRPLLQVKDQIRRTLQAERGQALLEERAQSVSAALRRGKSLDEAGKEQGLTAQKSPPLARGETADPLRSATLVSRAFELKPGEVDKDGFAVPRGYAFIALAEVKPAHVPELKEVQDKVKADVLADKAQAKARTTAEDLKARADKSGDKGGLEKAAIALGLVRKETTGLVGRGQPLGDLGTGIALEEVAYALPEKTLSDPVRAGNGFAILRVLEKKAFDPVAFEKEKASLVASLRDERRNQMFQAYMAQARQHFSVERNTEAFRRAASR